MNTTSATLIYITAPNREEAILLSRELLGKKLAACANIIDHVTSLYHWNAEIEQNNEVVIVLKTFAEHMDSIIETVKSMHSYACPAIVAVPLSGGNPDYLQWMQEQAPVHP
ncbi:MAG TPA: divalent-cation tolerance protein CutA [Rickettsiales bacterium]|nr:divalent-cation tolerance protein CutA [Rickettsiales bacterium]